MTDDLSYFFEFTLMSIFEHIYKLSCVLSFWIFIVTGYKLYFKKKNTVVYKTESIQSISSLNKFRSDLFNNDNSVYLTKFKLNTYMLYIVHILHGLFLYFTDIINFFCLIIAIGQVCIFGDFRSLLPLTIFAIISVIEYMYETHNIIVQQFTINDKQVDIIRHSGNMCISQKDIIRGDFIELKYGDTVPADILLIGQQKIMVNELELTGENIVVPKTGIIINNSVENILHINHYQNTGLIRHDTSIHEYTKNNIVFRGTEIVDGILFGVVIECGNDCQIYRLDYNINKNKTPIQEKLTKICTRNLYVLFFLSSVLGFVIIDKTGNTFSWSDLILNICRIILLFNTMIPLSLQFFFNISSVIISKRIAKQQQIKFNTNGIRSFQVNPQFIVTDKTGTLTTNKIDLVECWHNGVNVMVEPNTNSHTLFQNVLSCTSIDLHSKTKQILKSDILEELLLNFVMDKTKYQLVSNHVDEISGHFEYTSEDTTLYEIERFYFKNFSYDTGVKSSIIKSNGQYVLHIQGMPERICDYVNQIGASELLHTIENTDLSSNSYKRVIAHASKIISEKDVYNILSNDTNKHLSNFTDWSIYVFNDYVVDEIYQTISKMDNDITMLTGDKLSSAINVGKTVGLITDRYSVIENIDDLNKIAKLNFDTCVMSGQLVESLINTIHDYKLQKVLLAKRKIIYRASPHVKQMYVSYLQKTFNKSVMMVGDGSNDVSALIQADIGVAIKGESQTAQQVADIVIDTWTKIPKMLDDFKNKQVIINNVSQWVLMKHMLTAFTLFGMIIVGFFETIKDPANPALMAFMNGVLFLYMCKYSHYENIETTETHTLQQTRWMIEGCIIGLMNGIFVFSNNSSKDGIYLAISSQLLVLILKLHLIETHKTKCSQLFHFVSLTCIICMLYFLGNIVLVQYIIHLASTTLIFFIIDSISKFFC